MSARARASSRRWGGTRLRRVARGSGRFRGHPPAAVAGSGASIASQRRGTTTRTTPRPRRPRPRRRAGAARRATRGEPRGGARGRRRPCTELAAAAPLVERRIPQARGTTRSRHPGSGRALLAARRRRGGSRCAGRGLLRLTLGVAERGGRTRRTPRGDGRRTTTCREDNRDPKWYSCSSNGVF